MNSDFSSTSDVVDFKSTSSLFKEESFNDNIVINDALLEQIIHENTPFIKDDEPMIDKEKDEIECLLNLVLSSIDYDLLHDFLIVHRGFTKTEHLFHLLIIKLNNVFINQNEDSILKIRLFVMLKTWIGEFLNDDFKPSSGRLTILKRSIEDIWLTSKSIIDSDRLILERLEALSKHKVEQSSPEIEETSLIKRMKMKFFSSSDSGKNTSSSFDWEYAKENDTIDDSLTNSLSQLSSGKNNFNMLKYSIEQVTTWFIFLDSEYFERINWLELVSFPNIIDDSGIMDESVIQRSIDHFNQICKFIISLIKESSKKQQPSLISKFIRIANRLIEKGDYNSMMAIVLALQNPNLESLKGVWEDLSNKDISIWANLLKISSPLRNFSNIRNEQENKKLPIIPFIGLYFSDLMILNEKISNNEKLNFESWRGVAKIVKSFRKLQQEWAMSNKEAFKVDEKKLKSFTNQIYKSE